MPEQEVRVKFEPSGRTVSVPQGTKILDAAVRAGVALDTPCGGHGTCGKCRVRLVDGTSQPSDTERATLTPAELAAGLRLACQACVSESCLVEVPEESILAGTFQILGGGDAHAALGVADAGVSKQFIALSRPDRDDASPDVERLERVLGPFEIDLALLRELPHRLREGDWRGTVTLADGRLIDFEPGVDTTAECCGVAFDVGTTTVVGVLLDLVTGRERAACSRMNPQTGFGDDVLSRILYATQHATGLHELQQAIAVEISDMIRELADRADVSAGTIYQAAFAGNTTMLHLLAGIDPHALGQVPFTPAYRHGLHVDAATLGLPLHPRASVYLFPVTGGFVGGDTVACILATDLERAPSTTVLVDIGTNGEIVVSYEGRLLSASTAAGPAFEGARISDGMRAAVGAIEHVTLDADVRVDIIGDVAPVGLCGSALLDLVAELLRCGLLDLRGALRAADEVPEGVSEALRVRIVEDEQGRAFIIVPAELTKTGAPIRLTQRDVREFQLAVAAIRSGVKILLSRVGLDPSQVARVLIAGGFGNYLRPENAQRVGLLPHEVPPERIHFVGNASLAGARMALASLKDRERGEHIAAAAEHVDLSLDPEFQMEFAMAMFFPEATAL